MAPSSRSWWISRHAERRMSEMGLEWEEVEAALEEPELTYPSEFTRRMAVRGRLAVAYDPADHVVVTVLWHRRNGRAAA